MLFLSTGVIRRKLNRCLNRANSKYRGLIKRSKKPAFGLERSWKKATLKPKGKAWQKKRKYCQSSVHSTFPKRRAER